MPDFVTRGQTITAQWANDVVSAIRYRDVLPRRGYSGGGAVEQQTPCPFGSIITKTVGVEKVRVILGGIVHCGDKNYTVDDYQPSLTVDRDVQLYFEIDCTVNRDDYEEILLPGVITGAWTPNWEETSDVLPDSDNPIVSTGQGTIVISVGRLIIENGRIKSYIPSGCGNFTIHHCAGTLTYTQGATTPPY